MSAEAKTDKDVVEVVDLDDAANVAYWCSRWEVSEQELRAAVEHAGAVDAPAVSFALEKDAP